MKALLQLLVALFCTLSCKGASITDQLKHIEESRRQSRGFGPDDLLRLIQTQNENNDQQLSLDDILGLQLTRRFVDNLEDEGTLLGQPSSIYHLPEAEPILPGHTLMRPALGMLKSAIKFPHKDMVDGSGVYGNANNIGMTWDGTNDRVVYSGFRRHNRDDNELVIVPPTRELRYQDGPNLF